MEKSICNNEKCKFYFYYVDKAADLFSVNPRMEAAVIASTPTKPEPVPASVEPPKPATPINSAHKGISSKLLEKVFIYLNESFQICLLLRKKKH